MKITARLLRCKVCHIDCEALVSVYTRLLLNLTPSTVSRGRACAEEGTQPAVRVSHSGSVVVTNTKIDLLEMSPNLQSFGCFISSCQDRL